MKIGFLGPKGSFSHHVAQEAFPADTLVAFENITEVVKAYETGEVDYSVVPFSSGSHSCCGRNRPANQTTIIGNGS